MRLEWNQRLYDVYTWLAANSLYLNNGATPSSIWCLVKLCLWYTTDLYSQRSQLLSIIASHAGGNNRFVVGITLIHMQRSLEDSLGWCNLKRLYCLANCAEMVGRRALIMCSISMQLACHMYVIGMPWVGQECNRVWQAHRAVLCLLKETSNLNAPGCTAGIVNVITELLVVVLTFVFSYKLKQNEQSYEHVIGGTNGEIGKRLSTTTHDSRYHSQTSLPKQTW